MEKIRLFGARQHSRGFRGNAAIEYGLVLAALSLVVVVAADTLGLGISDFFNRIAVIIGGA
jgi:Flp pilus assembly pilin Flp